MRLCRVAGGPHGVSVVFGSHSSPCAGSAASAAGTLQQPGADAGLEQVIMEEQFNLPSWVPHLLQEDRDCLWLLLLESCVAG